MTKKYHYKFPRKKHIVSFMIVMLEKTHTITHATTHMHTYTNTHTQLHTTHSHTCTPKRLGKPRSILCLSQFVTKKENKIKIENYIYYFLKKT